MEYIPGDDLLDILQQRGRPLDYPEVLSWADQLLDALDYLHSQNPPIIHRDIKPQNLKLTAQGHIILLDFGLAKGTAGNMSLVSADKSVLGFSLNYAPLEQIHGAGTSPRSDLYSLSATLYHLLTGVPPADAMSRAVATLSGLSDPLLPANQINAQIPATIAEILYSGMAQNPEQRPHTAAIMRRQLANIGVVESGELKSPALQTPFADIHTNKDLSPTTLDISTPLPIAVEPADKIVPLSVPPVSENNIQAQKTEILNSFPNAGSLPEEHKPQSRSSVVKVIVFLFLILSASVLGAAAFYGGIYFQRQRQETAQGTNSATEPAASPQTSTFERARALVDKDPREWIDKVAKARADTENKKPQDIDDPEFLYFYGRALFLIKDYNGSLEALRNASAKLEQRSATEPSPLKTEVLFAKLAAARKNNNFIEAEKTLKELDALGVNKDVLPTSPGVSNNVR
jgi:serine/threonine protein kinase